MLNLLAVIFHLLSAAAGFAITACLIGAVLAAFGANVGLAGSTFLLYAMGSLGVWFVCAILANAFAGSYKWG